ncbi:MAG: choice-of-anchor D domain-containing protein [Myxococcaceae bacterium]
MTIRRAAAVAVLVVGMVFGLGCGDRSARSTQAELNVLPERLDFDKVAVGSSIAIPLQLSNWSRFSVTLQAIDAPAGVTLAADLPLTLAAGESRTVSVLYKPVSEGAANGIVQLKFDSNSEVALPLEAEAGFPAIAFAEQRLDFGEVPLGEQRAQTLRLKNLTAFKTSVTLALQGDDPASYEIDRSGPVMLLPNQEASVPVTFNPGQLGGSLASVAATVCPSCSATQVELAGSAIASTLEVTPVQLNFGRVELGKKRSETVTVTNRGDETFKLEGIDLTSADGAFALNADAPSAGLTLAPGKSVSLSVAFAPKVPGAARTGLLGFRFSGGTAAAPKIRVLGEGGKPCISVNPSTLDFSTVPQGMTVSLPVEVTNACATDVSFNGATTQIALGGFFSVPDASPRKLLSGETAKLSVVFTPKPNVLSSAGTMTLSVTAGTRTETHVVALVGQSKAFAPCNYSLRPASLDFGFVPLMSAVTLSAIFTNNGTTDCYLAGFGTVDGSDSAFQVAPLPPQLVAGGANVVLPVTFRPSASGAASALVQGFVNHTNPVLRYFTVLADGTGATSCVSLEPATLAFGAGKLSCSSRSRALVIKNDCGLGATVESLTIGSSTSAAFAVTNAPLPLHVPAFGRSTINVSYSPAVAGPDSAALRVELASGLTLTAGLSGRASVLDWEEDVFEIRSEEKVDVLFVVDNSGSMDEEQKGLANNFNAFVEGAVASGIDYRIAVTTTGIDAIDDPKCPGGAGGGEHGRFFPVDGASPRVITPYLSEPAKAFAHNVQVGTCHFDERGLEAAYRALSPPLVNSADDPTTMEQNDGNVGFLRSEARLAIIIVSDEDDASAGQVEFYETFFKGLKKDPGRVVVSAIVGTGPTTCPTAAGTGYRYLSLANSTGGAVEPICSPNWSAALKNVSSPAFSAKKTFTLEERPGDASQISVEIDGVPATGFTYDATTNSVTVNGNIPVGSRVKITYPLGC